MAVEHFFVRHLQTRNVYFRFYAPATDKFFDFATDTWEDVPVNPKLAATEKIDVGDADESGYVASLELQDLWQGQEPLNVLVQALDDLIADVVLDEQGLVISGGETAAVAPGAATLDAVNEMLRAIKQFPVDELDTGGVSDAAEAERVLDIHDLRIQAEGWYENRGETTLTPDAISGKIAIAGTILSVDTIGADEDTNVSVRAGYLYNLDDSTDVFTAALEVEIVYRLPFASLSTLLRSLIIASAKVEFQQYQVGNDSIDVQLKQELYEKRLRARKSDQENADITFTGGEMVNTILGGKPQYGRR